METIQEIGDFMLEMLRIVSVLCWDSSPLILLLWSCVRHICSSDYAVRDSATLHIIRYFLSISLLGIRLIFWNYDAVSLDLWTKILSYVS